MSQIRSTAATVAIRVCETLGAVAAAATRIPERDAILLTQQDLRRNAGVFQSVFHEALRDRVSAELGTRADSRRKLAATDWKSLSLVQDHEVEERMNFERIGQMISHECEWELRDLAPYMGAVTGLGTADEDKNPLRADVLGAALYRGIEAVCDNPEGRKLLARELGQAMAQAMPGCYGEILRGFQQRGVKPVVLTVRTVEGPGHQLPGLNSAYDSLPSSTRSGHGDLAPDTGAGSSIDLMHRHRQALATSPPRAAGRGSRAAQEAVGTHADTTHADSRGGRSRITSPADAQLMNLLRRLTAVASRAGDFSPAPLERGPLTASGHAGYSRSGVSESSRDRMATQGGGAQSGRSGDFISAGQRSADPGSVRGDGADPAYADGLTGLMAVNLIRAHRDELMQASTGKLDHMVIDVVGSLFDQILSDSRVPPQMARQIARLQLPVLRVALNDQTFFSTRRHPVRRFINRIASLACAFEDFDEGPGRQFIGRVSQLVQEIVEGDFDQIDLYAAKLAELERFIAEQTEGVVEQSGTAATLATKESELRIQQRYMQQIRSALAPLQLPQYLNDFLPQVWSQALVQATRQDGLDSDRAKRFRRVGCDLVMSIQPKGSPMFRKKFLMQLPPLMKDLNEGMKLIGWPEAAQREFFGKLLPAHAESLKGQPLSELDHNLMVKQLEAIFAMPIPGIESVSLVEPVEVEDAAIERGFTPEEAQQVGLVAESAVDWKEPVDIDLDLGAAPVDEAGESIRGTTGSDAALGPTTTESGEPGEAVQGAQLIDHIKVGFAYQMLLKDEWQKVRLSHVSSGRSFFVFTRGARHQETISMTARMLARMCEAGRMRAVESAYLMERATHRARKQLAELKTPTRH